MAAKRKPGATTTLFTPLQNGLDFIHSALEHLQGQDDARSLKYGTLHLWSGIELLLKVRLQREDWKLVFADPKKANLAQFEAGTFVSAYYGQCVDRLAAIAVVNLSAKDRITLTALQAKRNRFQHFGISDSITAAQSAASGALSVVLDTILPALEPWKFSPQDKNTVAEIRTMLGTLETFVAERWAEIQPRVDAASVVLACPDCTQEAAEIDDGFACLFCGGRIDPEAAASRYAEEILGIYAYDVIKDGGEDPVRECPSCERNTLIVNHGAGGDMNPSVKFTCTSCGEQWHDDELEDCSGCGELYNARAADCAVCDRCLENAASRDD